MALAGTGCGELAGHVGAILIRRVAGAFARTSTRPHFKHDKLFLWQLLGLWEYELGWLMAPTSIIAA